MEDAKCSTGGANVTIVSSASIFTPVPSRLAASLCEHLQLCWRHLRHLHTNSANYTYQ